MVMSIIKDPVLFSTHFGISKARLADLGVFDPILNVDTPLFIDPLLLASSSQSEIQAFAPERQRDFFSRIITLLRNSRVVGDVAWRSARRLFSFHELKGTCLGYGAGSISGSGFGPKLTEQLLTTANEIVQLGIVDPDLFFLLALLEEGIGADRVSDMTTNIILPDLLNYSVRIQKQLWTAEDLSYIQLQDRQLVKNPCVANTPIIFVPSDILRSLPVSLSWHDINHVCHENTQLRERINKQIGEVWHEEMSTHLQKGAKKEFKQFVMEKREHVEAILDAVKSIPPISYNIEDDEQGLYRWLHCAQDIVAYNPHSIARPSGVTLDELSRVASEIIQQFKKLIEHNGLWKEVWIGSKVRSEKSVQRLFFAVADTYCKANNLDITPEADSGTGPVDFKFSSGYSSRHIVEIKLSNNSKLVKGYEKQLEAYRSAEATDRATYLVIEVSDWKAKRDKISKVMGLETTSGKRTSQLVSVNAMPQESASNR